MSQLNVINLGGGSSSGDATLRSKNVRTTRFVIIGAGTSGTVTLPPSSTVILDDFGGTVDAVVTVSSGSKPTQVSALTSAGQIVATSFDASGNYTFTGTPASYPVALVYRVSQQLIDFDSTGTDIWGGSEFHDVLSIADGGTGFTAVALADVIYGSGVNALSKLTINTTANRYLSNQGLSSIPAWNPITLSNGVTGALPVPNGGTGVTTTILGDVIYASAANTLSTLATNTTASRYLSNQGVSSIPAWSPIILSNGITGVLPVPNGGTGFTAATLGDIIYASGANALTKLAANTTASRYLSNQGVSSIPAWNPINLNNGVTSILGTTFGGTGATTFTKGSVIFAGTNGVYSQDNANLFWNGASHILSVTSNIGIGTTLPSNTLEVVAPVSSTVLVYNNNPTSNPYSSINLKNYRGQQGSGDPTISTYVARGTAGAEDTVVTDMLILNLTGGGSSVDGFWDTIPSVYVRGIATGNWTPGGNIPSALTFGSSANEIMRINQNGNVGIGTTGPTAQIHSTGSVRFANFGAGAATFDANGNISSVSDETLKDIQRDYSEGTKQIKSINPIVYKWKDITGLDTENEYVGWSAQNINSVLSGSAYSKAIWINSNGEKIRDQSDQEKQMGEAEAIAAALIPFQANEAALASAEATIYPDDLTKQKTVSQFLIKKKELSKTVLPNDAKKQDLLSVNDRAIVAALVNSIKELDARISLLET